VVPEILIIAALIHLGSVLVFILSFSNRLDCSGLLFVHGIRRSENDYLTEGMNTFDHQDQSSRSQRFGGSTLTLIVIVIPMMVVATPSAKSGIIPYMLAFVHTFTVGAVNFSAVGLGDIFVP
jgi:hypothetical protein